MNETERWAGWIGRSMVGANGGELGQIVDIYVDEDSNQAEWATIRTVGRDQVRFVPLARAQAEGDALVVPWDHSLVDTSPALPYDGALTESEEAALYRHYDLARANATPPADTLGPDVVRSDSATPAADTSTAAAVTRSEEELRVTTVPREAGRVRLRKWVEKEHVSHIVPVAHEEVRVERQPINAANVDEALADAQLGATEYEVVLHEDQVVAAKVAVPKERVHVEKTVVTEDQRVQAELRKERVDIERTDVSSGPPAG